jgi:guanylate kinase
MYWFFSRILYTRVLSAYNHGASFLSLYHDIIHDINQDTFTGKGTIINRILSRYPSKIGLSVSHTSRSPRTGEVNGTHYHFASKDFMLSKIQDDRSSINNQMLYFLEYAEVHGNIYGTSYEAVTQVQSDGKICLLDVDVRGVKSIKLISSTKSSDALSSMPYYVFIAPPSFGELQRRLTLRNTETPAQLELRLSNARQEVEYGLTPGNFDKIIVNDDLDEAVAALDEFLGGKFPVILR